MEVWRPIEGWPRYEVSSEGRVRSRDTVVGATNGSTALRKGRVLKLVSKGGRYLAVTLCDVGLREQVFVHDIVAANFVGPKPEGAQTRHLDDCKTNNRWTNLVYGTALDNAKDRDRNDRTQRGERHGMAVLTPGDVQAIRRSSAAGVDLAPRYGVTAAHISSIRRRRVWKHVA